MPPTNLRAFADISFDGNTITEQVINYTLPVVQRARIDIPGKRTAYPRLGRLNPMSFTLTISSASSAYLGGLGVSHAIEVVEELETPGQANSQLTAEVTGDLEVSTPAIFNPGADEVRDITLTFTVKKYKLIQGSVTVYDIDIDADTYTQNGTPMFSGDAAAS